MKFKVTWTQCFTGEINWDSERKLSAPTKPLLGILKLKAHQVTPYPPTLDRERGRKQVF